MGGLLTFLMGRLTLLMLRLKSRGSAHVLDRTSYVVDVTLKVLGWVGVGDVDVLDRTSYVVDVTLKNLGWGGVRDLLTFLIGRLTLLMLP